MQEQCMKDRICLSACPMAIYGEPGVQTEEKWCEILNLKFYYSVAKEKIATI